jgi:hypothetical protein
LGLRDFGTDNRDQKESFIKDLLTVIHRDGIDLEHRSLSSFVRT